MVLGGDNGACLFPNSSSASSTQLLRLDDVGEDDRLLSLLSLDSPEESTVMVWVTGLWASGVADWASKLAGWASKLADWANTLAGWASKLADWVSKLADWVGKPADWESMIASCSSAASPSTSSITIGPSAANNGEAIEGARDKGRKGKAAGEKGEAVCSGTIRAAGIGAIGAAGGLSGGDWICRKRLGILVAN